jgi:hypothetical protein
MELAGMTLGGKIESLVSISKGVEAGGWNEERKKEKKCVLLERSTGRVGRVGNCNPFPLPTSLPTKFSSIFIAATSYHGI